jgi:biopolymer transport protein ExbD
MAAGGSAEPNLTPFIDLFSVLIVFLLMSTAWINLEVLPSNIEKATSSESSPSTAQSPPPDEKKINLSVDMKFTEVALNENGEVTKVLNFETGLDVESIVDVLRVWKERYPSKNDIVLNTDGNVKYGHMIKMYDMLVANDFPEVGINPQ